MAPARPLHDILAGLAGAAGVHGDATAVLRAGGHAELPADLLTEAVVSYADTAPVEVAEHLAPFVMAHGPVPGQGGWGEDPVAALDLLASAPGPGRAELGLPEVGPDPPGGPDRFDLDRPEVDAREPAAPEPPAGGTEPVPPPVDARFGLGGGPAPGPADAAPVRAELPEPVPDLPGGAPDPLPLDPPPALDPWAVPAVSGEPAELDELTGEE